ncbi:MAG: hypothetical protein Q3960_03415 [Lactobacillus sp.]|nr:hypothetical protein [Lactobacillus sp.]
MSEDKLVNVFGKFLTIVIYVFQAAFTVACIGMIYYAIAGYEHDLVKKVVEIVFGLAILIFMYHPSKKS